MISTKVGRILTGLEVYKNQTGCKGVVLGLSGGKDSTVVAMLAKRVWGNNVFAIIMPNGEQKDISDAITVAETLGIEYRAVNIETIYNNLVLNIEQQIGFTQGGGKEWIPNCPKISDKALTNIPPRIRMTILYAVAQTLGYRVIGTGNMSERYIGWFTKYGDGGCDLNPLGHLTCTEVVEAGKHLAKQFGLQEEFIVKTPADGLTGKYDEDNFGFTYAQLDSYIMSDSLHDPGTCGDEEIDAKIRKLHEASEHKRTMPYLI